MGADEAVGGTGQSRRTVAVVVEERPRLIFLVRLENQQEVLAHLAGMVQRNFVRLVPGDRVEVELAPHDPTRGKILKKV